MDRAYTVVTSSPLGKIWICATDYGICALEFGEKVGRLARYLVRHQIDVPDSNDALLSDSPSILDKAVEQLAAYFERRLRQFDLPLDLRGTPFQLAVWDELLHIPYGQTLTYGEIALEVERPRASQAVGGAVGANPVSIIVPCHRVLGHDGALTGYAYGIERKEALLQLEQAGLQLRFQSSTLGTFTASTHRCP